MPRASPHLWRSCWPASCRWPCSRSNRVRSSCSAPRSSAPPSTSTASIRRRREACRSPVTNNCNGRWRPAESEEEAGTVAGQKMQSPSHTDHARVNAITTMFPAYYLTRPPAICDTKDEYNHFGDLFNHDHSGLYAMFFNWRNECDPLTGCMSAHIFKLGTVVRLAPNARRRR